MRKKCPLRSLHRLSGCSSYKPGNCALTVGEGVAGVTRIVVELFGDDFHPSVEVSHLSLECQRSTKVGSPISFHKESLST